MKAARPTKPARMTRDQATIGQHVWFGGKGKPGTITGFCGGDKVWVVFGLHPECVVDCDVLTATEDQRWRKRPRPKGPHEWYEWLP